ncbi:MAG: glycosyltransferase family 4 protein, partial [Spirochaetaceae bacterium]|nr:glycosyltransferase family 4 protein [Spirochaetaceae bacterium]
MKTAIVHYWLVNMRGGEKVLEALLEMFPDADIYTHVYDKENISEKINAHTIYTSYINKLPFAKKFYQKYLPLMPAALLDFDLQKYDLVISSEAGPAKGIVARPDA